MIARSPLAASRQKTTCSWTRAQYLLDARDRVSCTFDHHGGLLFRGYAPPRYPARRTHRSAPRARVGNSGRRRGPAVPADRNSRRPIPARWILPARICGSAEWNFATWQAENPTVSAFLVRAVLRGEREHVHEGSGTPPALRETEVRGRYAQWVRTSRAAHGPTSPRRRDPLPQWTYARLSRASAVW